MQDDRSESAFYQFSAWLGVAALGALVAAVVSSSLAGGFGRETIAFLAAAALLGALYVIPRWAELRETLAGRQFRTGSNVGVLSAAVIGILVVLNIFAARYGGELDLTATRQFTLSDQTRKVLQGLPGPVQATAFFPAGDESGPAGRGARALLEKYARQSGGKLRVEFVDPELSPSVAQRFGITTYPITVFQMGERREQTTGLTEQDFTSTLLKLSKNERKKVYILQGHNELDPDSVDRNGFSAAAEALKQENYDVATLSLIQQPAIPEDAAVLLIPGPRVPIPDAQREAISQYLDRGGRVFLLVGPAMRSGLEPLLESWYVKLEEGIVLDPGRSYAGDPFTPAPLPQRGHRITTSLPELLFPAARPIRIISGAPDEVRLAPLLRTTDRAWGETTPPGPTAPPRLDEGQDSRGPLTLALAVNRVEKQQATPTPGVPPPEPKSRGRLVVAGSVAFATNDLVTNVLGNRDFLVNAVNWLAEEEALISIRAAAAAAPQVFMTNRGSILTFYMVVVFIPLAVFLWGAVVWWQRR